MRKKRTADKEAAPGQPKLAGDEQTNVTKKKLSVTRFYISTSKYL